MITPCAKQNTKRRKVVNLKKLSHNWSRLLAGLLALTLLISVMPVPAARAAEEDSSTTWTLADPANLVIGRKYVIVSADGALINSTASIEVAEGTTRDGMGVAPVTVEGDKITSDVTPDMIWTLNPGKNTAAAADAVSSSVLES